MFILITEFLTLAIDEYHSSGRANTKINPCKSSYAYS